MGPLRGPYPVVPFVRIPEQLRLSQTRPRTEHSDRTPRVGRHVVERQNVFVARSEVKDAVAICLEVVENRNFDACVVFSIGETRKAFKF